MRSRTLLSDLNFAAKTNETIGPASRAEVVSDPDHDAEELAKAPSCLRIGFETDVVPILFHWLSQLRLPVVRVESRSAYQALRSLATQN
jgi:hypothetical protein